MARKYDVVVIGSGPAGRQAGVDLKKAGLSAAMIESYGFGGTCPLRGCEPKKVLVDAAFTAARAADMRGQGIEGTLGLNWPELMKFNRSMVDPVPEQVESRLNMQGVDTYFGQARFAGPNLIEVDGEELEGKFVVIAVGAEPLPLDFPGRELVSSSDVFLELKEAPRRVVFIGGGFISFEFAHVAARAGAEAVILHRSGRALKAFDSDLADLQVRAMRDLGVDVRLNAPLAAVTEKGGALTVRAGREGELTFETDLVVHGAGRVPALKGLNLDKAGVAYTSRGVTVNEYMQSVSNPWVYAAGDAADFPPPLTPAATVEAAAAAHNILFGNRKKVDHSSVPSVVFTYPPLARVGLLEEEAIKKGLKFKKIFRDTSDLTEHRRIGLKHGGFKLLLDEDGDRVLGAHILGEKAEEVINVFALALRHGLSATQLKEMVWAYPSFIYNTRYMWT
ncbi:MAG: NAD(P)/FAD-dependent oxidoreductase [Pseudomonadota bacterium]